MKKFFMVTPQQAQGHLRKQEYRAEGNSQLAYGETRFPIIPVINGYLDEGEACELITVTYDSDDCRRNIDYLKAEVGSVCESKNASFEIKSIDVPFDDSVASSIRIFQKLIDHVADGDELFACVTFGSKLMPIVLTMALQYAYRLKNDVCMECVVYGQIDRSKQPQRARIYDVTALVELDEIVRILADKGVDNPELLLKTIINS